MKLSAYKVWDVLEFGSLPTPFLHVYSSCFLCLDHPYCSSLPHLTPVLFCLHKTLSPLKAEVVLLTSVLVECCWIVGAQLDICSFVVLPCCRGTLSLCGLLFTLPSHASICLSRLSTQVIFCCIA